MSEDVMLQEAIQAIRQGQRVRARDLLTRLLRTNQNNPEYWLWMSSVVDTPKEQIYCLQAVLKLDPKNQSAQQGMVLLGARAPEGEVVFVPPIRRRWEVDLQEVPRYSTLAAIWANPLTRIVFFTFMTLVLAVLIGLGAYGLTHREELVVAKIPTRTPGPLFTFTTTPTAINYTPPAATPLPQFTGPPPLWMSLESTYTPTPLYVNTPHIAAGDAFLAAQRSLQRNDTNAALVYFEQAMQMDQAAADIPYYIGELYRQRGDYQKALEYYGRSQQINPNFAPAYLGIARVKFLQDSKADISREVELAIEKDPSFGEAYLERASLRLRQGETRGAKQDLDKAGELMPESPLIYLYQAQIALSEGDVQAALENAKTANQLDLTLLPAYRIVGEAAARNGDSEQALEALEVYLLYIQDDPTAWLIQGEALYSMENYTGTLEALNKAIQLDKGLTEAFIYRGLTYIALGQGQKAVNEIYSLIQTDPTSFEINLTFGRALLAAGRLGDALGQINRSLNLAKMDEEKAQAYYWRALTLEEIGNMPSALKDWKALLALPEEAYPNEWKELAEEHLQTTSTPAPTLTLTPSPTKTPLPPTSTATEKASSTPTPTPTRKTTTPPPKTPSPTPD